MAAMLPIADVTQVAAVSAAATALLAALAGLANLRMSVVRDRPALTSFAREWATGPEGSERYVEVCVANVGTRPISVVSIGVTLTNKTRAWRETGGTITLPLPAKLEDGEIVAMIWLRDELGREFYEGDASIVECFAIDGRGTEVTGSPPGAKGSRGWKKHS